MISHIPYDGLYYKRHSYSKVYNSLQYSWRHFDDQSRFLCVDNKNLSYIQPHGVTSVPKVCKLSKFISHFHLQLFDLSTGSTRHDTVSTKVHAASTNITLSLLSYTHSYVFIMPRHLQLRLQSSLFPLCFPTNIFMHLLAPPCPRITLLHLIVLIIFRVAPHYVLFTFISNV
jgi:hypothetical protein